MALYLGKDKVGMVKQFYKPDRLQWKCDNVKSLWNEFYGYNGQTPLTILEGLDTSKVENMRDMFSGCSSLTEIDVSGLNTSNVTNMRGMFSQCRAVAYLDVSKFNTSKVTDFYQMFYQCDKLNNLDVSKFNTSKATTLFGMFWNCFALTEIDVSSFDLSATANDATAMNNLFNGCSKLTKIGTLDLYPRNTGSLTSLFTSCRQLQELWLKNIRRNITIGSGTSYGTLINKDSLINTVKELWDYSSGTTTYTLTMSTASKELIADVYVKLVDVTPEMLTQDQYADQKLPCVECESTDDGAMTLTAYANLKNWTIA